MSTIKWFTRFGMTGGALLLLAIGFMLGTASSAGQVRAQQSTMTDIERTHAAIYDQVGPSVVSIEVDQLASNTRTFVPLSSGSGFVIDTNGHIVTNYHVIEGGDRIAINFLNGIIVRADVVGTDPDSDLAVLRVNLPANELRPVTLGNSDTLVVGQTALAIGSPFGERWTLTTGIISALDRTITGLSNFSIGAVIQTDAAINPGNSGGPLLNLRGEVIGVNSQIATESGRRANSGVGFAVPSNLVARVAGELIRNGRVNYSYLGIGGDEINLDYIERYNLPNNTRGVVITLVSRGGPAEQGGLRDDSASSIDVVTAVDGRPVINMSSLIGYLASSTQPGQTVTLTVLRDGRLINLNITLGVRPR